MKIKARLLITLTMFTVASLAQRAHAADITWQDAQDITGTSDVGTLGEVVGAFNIGSVGVPDTTVNGVTFHGFETTAGSGSSGNFTATGTGFISQDNTGGSSSAAPFASLPAPYQTLLESYTVPYAGTVTLSIVGLTVGDQYQFEFFSNSSSGSFGYQLTASDLDGNSVTTTSNDGEAEGGLGQFALGAFTADAATETITFSGDGDGGFLNGFQLRDLTPIPEPSSLLLLGIGAGLLGWRCLKRAKGALRA
jgi:hypothetical protein